MRHPHVLQLLMDSLRYWVRGDARRRLPLRSRGDAGARAARRRSAVGVLRSDPAGPGGLAGEADCRAVGRRRGRLSGRQLPAAVVGVERQVSRHGARLLARPGPDAGRVRLALHRQLGSLRVVGAPAAREHQLRHRARRLHAARSGLLQRQAQRSQRRGQPRRREPQSLVEHGRRGRHRRSRRFARRERASSATSSPRCSCRRACRCCSAATRSAGRSAATTTPTARTTRSPGSTGRDVDDGAARVHARARSASAAAHPDVPAAPLVPGPAAARHRASATSAGSSRTASRCRKRNGPSASPSRSACS